jgi:ubiquinone/menaquinone biosynthesis C-methylase UbiE
MASQELIWEKILKNTTVANVVEQFRFPAIFQQELVTLLQDISNGTKCKIIEAGCEAGVTSMLLPDYFDSTLLDLNSLAINLAKEAHLAISKNAQFIQADMFEMPIDDSTFDIVFNAGVVEHFSKEERAKALKEYSRILKDSGTMIIAYPNHYSPPYRLAYLIRRVLRKWPYPSEYKIFDMIDEINSASLILDKRLTISKGSVLKWLNFAPPLKFLFTILDKLFNYEGYLTVLIIRKNDT